MKKRAAQTLVALALLFMGVAIGYNMQPQPPVTPTTQPQPSSSYIGIDTQEMHSLVNEYRAANELQPLNRVETLDRATNEKCEDMADNNYYAHVSPSGVGHWDFDLKQGYEYDLIGENLNKGANTTASALKGWQESEVHNDLLLEPEFTDVGYSVCRAADSELMVVQHLGVL